MEITNSYRITYSNGNAPDHADSYEDAVQLVRNQWGERCYAEQFADRALVWRNEQDSVDDDGANALASIYAE